MESIYLLIALIMSPVLGLGAYYYASKQDSDNEDDSVRDEEVSKQPIVAEARARAKEIIVEAKDKSREITQSAEDEADALTKDLRDKEKDLEIKETELKVKEEELESKQKDVQNLKEKLEEKEGSLDKMVRAKKDKLEEVASLTKEEAREELLKAYEKDLAEEKAKRLKAAEEDIKKNKERLAQDILVDAMRHGATDYVVQHTTSKVKLPDEDMKGRIIGKEGRNIKAFEEITGVELDLDSSDGEVIVSSFDPVRREIAKVALEKLVADGRIQPTRIEEIVEQTRDELDHLMYKEGDNLCHRVGVYDVPDDLVQMLGKFKYRFSYGQNMIEHTLEETRIGVAIAQALNADEEVVKLGCLFHDIGKVVTDDEGTHVELGVKTLKQYDIPEPVVNAVAEHHEDKPFSSVESAIVALADHVSGARPGARSEDYESYVERMKDLEEAATSFDGVKKAYAISAGREVRVFVEPDKVDDEMTALLARDIAKKIELEQSYPGVVNVTAIREKRVTETAK